MADIIIPVPPIGIYRWILEQELDGLLYRLFFKWNVRAGAWFIDFGNTNNVAQVRNIKVNLAIDKLAPYKYKDVPQGILSIVDSTGQGKEPTLDDFGSRVQIIYTPVADLEAATT